MKHENRTPGKSQLGRKGPPSSPARASGWATYLPLFLLGATLLAYQPVWQAGFIWDDDFYVTENSTLHDLNGLRRIWFEVGAVPQYYPLVHTVFWLENHIWGLQPLGFHLVNVLLHALAAILLARVLQRLRIRGAWLAGFIFALHPVGVESAAWVTELKNVLSTVLYLAAALAYWRFVEGRERASANSSPWRWYVAALVLFAAALFSKTVACSLPAAVLLVRWWDKGRVRAPDITPLIPFFVLGAGLGLQTAWIEKHSLGAKGATWALSFAESCLVAGRAVWFYLGKLLWPVNLTFIYPRWQISTAEWWQWLFPIAVIAVIAALWLTRERIGRGPLTALLFFVGTLAPALGFINVYPMRYSFVADHFQYLACLGPITLAAAFLDTQIERLQRYGTYVQPAIYGSLLLLLAIATWRQTFMYTDIETLWRTTIERNPSSSMAYNNLGNLLLKRGLMDEAQVQFQKAIDTQPNNPEAHDSLGYVLLQTGQVDAAIAHFRTALAVQSDQPRTYYNLGEALLKKGLTDEAITQLKEALRRLPTYTPALNSLGIAWLNKGDADAAITQFRESLRLQPNDVAAHNNLGTALVKKRQIDDAVVHYQAAVRLQPNFVDAYNNLRYVAWLLATAPDASLRNGAKAVELAQQVDGVSGGQNPLVIGTLAAAYAEVGRFPEAVANAQRAVQLANAQGLTTLASSLQTQLRSYEAGQAYRE